MYTLWNVVVDFNSHAHVERDRHRFFDHFRYTISTHTLTWSVTPRYVTHSYSSCNFNSHAHVERDPSDTQPKYVVFISTHTLTWSVTLKIDYFVKNSFIISTHTLTWSVTWVFL